MAPPYFVVCRQSLAAPMRPRFRAYIGSVTAAAVILGIGAVLAFPLWPSIAGPLGLGFWIVVIALGTSNSVRMPGGTIVDVSTAPLLACVVLGGPSAAALASCRRSVRSSRGSRAHPWYSRRRSLVRLCLQPRGRTHSGRCRERRLRCNRGISIPTYYHHTGRGSDRRWAALRTSQLFERMWACHP